MEDIGLPQEDRTFVVENLEHSVVPVDSCLAAVRLVDPVEGQRSGMEIPVEVLSLK